MKHPCGALLLSVAASWSAATSAVVAQSNSSDSESRFGPFEVTHELDADGLVSFGAGDADSELIADFRLRFDAEQVLQSGLRWGIVAELASHRGDGRRGLDARNLTLPPSSVGLVTGLGAQRREASLTSGFEQFEIYLKSQTFEVMLGQGQTAARRHRPSQSTALRLGRVDGGLVDPMGGALASTRLSLTEAAPGIQVQTRRLVGFVLAASIAPSADLCGPVQCRSSDGADIKNIVSVSADFDRRARSTGVRWQVQMAAEQGDIERGNPIQAYEDPYILSLSAVRSLDGVSVGVRALQTNDGLLSSRYRAVAGHIGVEQGEWLFSGELARAHSDLIDQSGWTAQLGASRFVGRKGLLGGAIRLQGGGSDPSGIAFLAEAGLRF